ncbi:MAG TPA: alpha-L-arabinofuranosidase C-terminal domain-containing protein [Steroidobacteraceae bacterium]|jgi:alpha-N-arabinofuranosidase|nr:alpha-L-arabinofuranosidase C-terminal domain-containing protein [Steroidobacteraceae bacterium]
MPATLHSAVILVLGAAALALTVGDAHAQPASGSGASAVVHADQFGAKIDRHIFGQFAEHLGRGIEEGVWVGEHSPIPNIRGIRKDVIAALRELHVPVVRWPGGCFADEYHWRDGIGPRAKRPVTLNTNWGGVPEHNAFGTHEFLDFAQLIGADAYINGNLGTGSAREMAEWLQYMTSDKATSLTAERARNGHPKPWKIAYFAVGNEGWGCGGNMTPEHYVDLFRQDANFLKAPRGGRPIIVASGGNDNDTSWTSALISKVNRDMGAISFHYYTIPGDRWQSKGPATDFGEDQWISTLQHTLRMDDYISRNGAEMDKYDPAGKIAFAVDEWGTWYDPEPGREPGFLYQQNTLRDAIVAALNFNVFQHHADRVRMANIAQMINVLQAMILTKGPQMILTPTYHVFKMYEPFQDATSLPADLSTPQYTQGGASVPAVSLSAARTRSGSIAVALVNLDPNQAIAVAVALPGASPSQVSGTLLTAAAMDAHNTFENPNHVHPVAFEAATVTGHNLSLSLPPKSIVVLNLH